MHRKSGAAGSLPVHIASGLNILAGELCVPDGARGVVLFAHGSGSGRTSPRNQRVAAVLQQGGQATLLIDLLSAEEQATDERVSHLRYEIRFLAQRLALITDWLLDNPATSHLPIGYFGSSTGAAAALVAATMRPDLVQAVVARGGRVDMAGPVLPHVQAPTLLIVGEQDQQVLELNRAAYGHLRCERQLAVVPGAGHLFEEPGALEHVAELAGSWFARHLALRERSLGE